LSARPAAAAALALLALTACGREPATGEDEEIRRRLEEKSSASVLREAGQASYVPPASGELTPQQVEMYIEVVARAGRIREVAAGDLEAKLDDGERGAAVRGFRDTLRSLGGLGDLLTAELRAAQELGHNPEEYEWVRERVLEAEAVFAERDLWAGSDAEDLAMLEAQRRMETDRDRRRQLDRKIADRRAAAPLEEELPPAVAHNLALIERYREAIDAAREPEASSSAPESSPR
jgi:hypothetical protein